MAFANTSIAPPASRNAPCPCGSGRRWKDCHGKAAPPVAEDGDLAATLRSALAAQQAGRFDEAIAAYDRVIGARPDLFDAWHMRGVARFQCLDFDLAERDIRQALAIAPGLAAARGNLALVVEGRRIAEDEVTLCRSVLPRYAPLAVFPPVAPLEGVKAGDRVVVLEASATAVAADALAREAIARGASVERIAVPRGRAVAADAASMLSACGERDVVACVGTGRPLGDWTLAAQPRAFALVVDDDDLLAFVDRLREVSGHGRRRVRIALAGDARLDLGALPHARSAL